MSPTLSVIVPIHNVESYLRTCLESIAGQAFDDLEVIMVDDGSTDNSAAIAKSFQTQDQRFRLIKQENQGLGPARNTGVRYATGKYLAFADSDDVVPRAAYKHAIGSLDRSGSDFACGNVCRLDESGKITQSWLHKNVFEAAQRTHVSQNHLLLRDRTAWNKVFRRSFWDAQGYKFPEGWYEDSPVTIHAHVMASAVDVLESTVYLWRRRSDSISEGRGEVSNIAQRLTVMLQVRNMLTRDAPHLIAAFDEHALLPIDMRILLNSLHSFSDDERGMLVALAAELMNDMESQVIANRSGGERSLLRLIGSRKLPELRELLQDRLQGGGFKAIRRRGRWYMDYPFLTETYDITDEIKPVAKIDRVCWDGDRLQVEGEAYLSGFYAPEPDALKVRFWLRLPQRRGRLLRVRVPGERLHRPELEYQGSGFTASIHPRVLKKFGRLRWNNWILSAELSTPGIKRKCRVGNTALSMANPPAERSESPGARVQPLIRRSSLVLRVRPDDTWRHTIAEELLSTGLEPDDGEFRRTHAWLAGRPTLTRSRLYRVLRRLRRRSRATPRGS